MGTPLGIIHPTIGGCTDPLSLRLAPCPSDMICTRAIRKLSTRPAAPTSEGTVERLDARVVAPAEFWPATVGDEFEFINGSHDRPIGQRQQLPGLEVDRAGCQHHRYRQQGNSAQAYGQHEGLSVLIP